MKMGVTDSQSQIFDMFIDVLLRYELSDVIHDYCVIMEIIKVVCLKLERLCVSCN